jgi:hypothetical protein
MFPADLPYAHSPAVERALGAVLGRMGVPELERGIIFDAVKDGWQEWGKSRKRAAPGAPLAHASNVTVRTADGDNVTLVATTGWVGQPFFFFVFFFFFFFLF